MERRIKEIVASHVDIALKVEQINEKDPAFKKS